MPVTKLTPEERRAKKAARRIEQRRQNVGRAEKMHKARIAAQKTFTGTQTEPPILNIGCSGWFYWHWKQYFYEGLETKQWFDHYASTFDTVELNAPFYSWPTVNTVKTWLTQAQGHDMVYTVKASELITHVKKFKGTKTLIKDFGYIADLLGPRMGCFIFQLPPSFHYSPARLRHIVEQLDPARRNVVEFRHVSWWNDDVYAAFKKAGIIFCSCSGPKLPDELIRTADEIYVRFHGPKRWYMHDYSTQELKIWAERIRKSRPKRVWAYFNNDFEGFAIKNALELKRLLQVTAYSKAA